MRSSSGVDELLRSVFSSQRGEHNSYLCNLDVRLNVTRLGSLY